MEPTPRRERSSSRKLLRYAPFVGILLAVILIWLLFGRSDDSSTTTPPPSGPSNGPVVFSAANKDSVDWGAQCDTSRGTVAVPLTYAPPCVKPFKGDNGGAT